MPTAVPREARAVSAEPATRGFVASGLVVSEPVSGARVPADRLLFQDPSAHCEAGFARRTLVELLDPCHTCQRRTMAAPGSHRFDILATPFEHRFHGPVVEVPHPARQRQSLRLTSACKAKANTLYPTVHDDTPSRGHLSSARPSAVCARCRPQATGRLPRAPRVGAPAPSWRRDRSARRACPRRGSLRGIGRDLPRPRRPQLARHAPAPCR
jgi:hypothetical protein